MAQSVKVDDQELTYSGDWKASGDCNGCSAAPNPEQMQFVNDGTWHDAARQADGARVTMSYIFEGTGVVVYGITVNGTTERPIIKNVNLTFSLDGVQDGAYQYTPDATVTDYQFNVPFFTKLGLNSGPHSLTMTLQPKSFVLLDYLVYYTETTPTANGTSNIRTSSTPSPSAIPDAGGKTADTPPIAHGGGLSTQTAVALAVLIPIVVGVATLAMFFWYLRRRAAKRQAEEGAQLVQPTSSFYGGLSGAPPTNAYSFVGTGSAPAQLGPFTPSDLRGASTNVTPRNPFEPTSHIPSSVAEEEEGTSALNTAELPVSASRSVMQEKPSASLPWADPAQQRSTGPPLYSP